jgi:hypothetical protein
MLATRWKWLAVAFVLALAFALAAFAAARRGDGDDFEARVACIDSKRGEARYVVVRFAYERGELGPRRVVIQSVDPRARGAIFRPDGDLRSWTGMSRPGRHEFIQWATSGRTYAKTGDAQERAVDAARRDCWSRYPG